MGGLFPEKSLGYTCRSYPQLLCDVEPIFFFSMVKFSRTAVLWISNAQENKAQ